MQKIKSIPSKAVISSIIRRIGVTLEVSQSFKYTLIKEISPASV